MCGQVQAAGKGGSCEIYTAVGNVLEISSAGIDNNTAVIRLARKSHFGKKTEDAEVRMLDKRLYQLFVCVSQSHLSLQLYF